MSCIAGLVHLGGAAVERELLERMLATMKRRAPDGDQVVCSGPVGLGQSFLRTGSSPAEQPNALTLDGKVFIAADARIDGRAELLGKLRSAGREVATDAPHAELILHAYEAFGDNFIDHLIGDFAFAIWDSRNGRLTCVRDRFGLRPFYYFQSDGVFGFASNIDALRAHPGVSASLNDIAVADFLTFGTCCEVDHTIYRDIKCLPPATRLDVSTAGVELSPYWQLPEHCETRFSSQQEYVERFTQLFDQAVKDRLPHGPIALQLSGGMDSTSIAAAAVAQADGQPVLALHSTYPHASGEERRLAQLAADHLGIPLQVQEIRAETLFQESRDNTLRTAFPLGTSLLGLHRDTMGYVTGAGGRVLLSGFGADGMLAPSSHYYPGLLRSGRFGKLAIEIAHHTKHTGSLSGMGLRSVFWRRRGDLPAWRPDMPSWIDPALARRVDLPARWAKWLGIFQRATDALDQLRMPWLHRQFEGYESLDVPVVVRYPFFDLRLVEYMLGLPNFMKVNKKIVRMAMKNRLPPPITSRPKTVVAGDRLHEIVTSSNILPNVWRGGVQWAVADDVFGAAWQAYCCPAPGTPRASSDLIILPIALANWSRNTGVLNE